MRKQLGEYYRIREEGPKWAEERALMFQLEPTSLGILAAQEACETKLVPDIPVLSADHFHRWVWQAARTLLD